MPIKAKQKENMRQVAVNRATDRRYESVSRIFSRKYSFLVSTASVNISSKKKLEIVRKSQIPLTNTSENEIHRALMAYSEHFAIEFYHEASDRMRSMLA